jgi:hypothetical protein
VTENSWSTSPLSASCSFSWPISIARAGIAAANVIASIIAIIMNFLNALPFHYAGKLPKNLLAG